MPAILALVAKLRIFSESNKLISKKVITNKFLTFDFQRIANKFLLIKWQNLQKMWQNLQNF